MFDDVACSLLTFYTFRLLPCLNHPAQDCNVECGNAWATCCGVGVTDDDALLGKCDMDKTLDAKCSDELYDCCNGAEASTQGYYGL